MSYSSYVSKLKSSSTTLSNNKEKVSNIAFESSWEGTASSKQVENIEKLDNAMTDVAYSINALAEVLQEIDNYDTYKIQKNMWQERVNSLSPSTNKDEYDNAQYNLIEATKRVNETKSQISNKLNSINPSYTSSISIISQTELVKTNDTFAKVFTSSSNINKAFEISQYVHTNYTKNPNFNNRAAWVSENPYSQAGLYGQCTWFAWGKFYEMYGYSPGFTGNGNQCANQLVNTHPDKFEISKTPKTGAVFSYKGYPYGHTGVITEVKDGMLTYMDGNYDNQTNSFEVAQSDWGTKTVPVEDFIGRYGGNIVFANPKTYTA